MNDRSDVGIDEDWEKGDSSLCDNGWILGRVIDNGSFGGHSKWMVCLKEQKMGM